MWLKKYTAVFLLSFKMQIVWRFDVAMTMVATTFRILAASILWSAVFNGEETVGGLTLQGMLSYYVVCSFISSLDFSYNISGEVSHLIKNGRFSGHMVTPMNPMGFFTSMTAGESAFHLAFNGLAAALCVWLLRINVIITANPVNLALGLVMALLGLGFMAAYHYFIGMLTFKFTEISFFLHVQSNIISFVTGTMVPLSLLPDRFLQILRLLPFTHVVYTPVMLLTGQTGTGTGLQGLSVLAIWTAAMVFLGQYGYRRLRIKYDGVGI